VGQDTAFCPLRLIGGVTFRVLTGSLVEVPTRSCLRLDDVLDGLRMGFGKDGGWLVKDRLMAGALAWMLLAQSGGLEAQAAQQGQQQAIPDAPKPQLVPGLTVTPGQGTTATSNGDGSTTDADAPGSTLPSNPAAQETHPDDGTPPPVTGPDAVTFTLRARVNFVEIPFTVKDSKNRLVPGLTWRDVRVYENNVRQHIDLFTTDPFPLSVALVIDQSLPFDTMTKVNNALGALQGAFTNYDEVAVFTYNNGPKMQTDFTAAQSARLGVILDRSKSVGREAYPVLGGPLAATTNINGYNVDPNTAPVRNGLSMQGQTPREVHTLNDAILAAAVATTKAGRGRRRIVYVISDGKEYGSTAKFADVKRYLQTNKIAVYGTLVGDPSIPGLGFLDRIHLPLQMRDNLLPQYTAATGGQVDPEFRVGGIEASFAKITEEVRTQYTVGYYSRDPFIDAKFRSVEIKVLRPNLTVIAKAGYYPSPEDTRPSLRPAGGTAVPPSPGPATAQPQ
jgi:VWFA-related protein